MRTANGRPYSLERSSLKNVGTGVPDGPTVQFYVFTSGFGENELHPVRTDNIRPYSLERSSLKNVGTGVSDGPAVQFYVFTPGFGENELHPVRADIESAPTV